MQQREVAGDQRRLRETLRGAERRRHRAVDAVQAAVAQHGKALVAFQKEGVERADAHGIGREQARPLRRQLHDAPHVRALERCRRFGDARARRPHSAVAGIVARCRHDAGARLLVRRHPGSKKLLPEGGRRKGGFRFAFRARTHHRAHELDGAARHEHVSGRVEVACLALVHNDLHRTRRGNELRRALRHGIAPEPHDHLGTQPFGSRAPRSEHAVVVVDDERLVEAPQTGKRIRQKRHAERARPRQNGARLLYRGTGALTRQHERTRARQQVRHRARHLARHRHPHGNNTRRNDIQRGNGCFT